MDRLIDMYVKINAYTRMHGGISHLQGPQDLPEDHQCDILVQHICCSNTGSRTWHSNWGSPHDRRQAPVERDLGPTAQAAPAPAAAEQLLAARGQGSGRQSLGML